MNYLLSIDETVFTVYYKNIQTQMCTLDTYNIEKVSNAQLISKITIDNGDFKSSKLHLISKSNRFLLCSIQYGIVPKDTGICRIFDTHTNEVVSDIAITHEPKKVYSPFEQCIFRMSCDLKYVATVYTKYEPLKDESYNIVCVWDIYGHEHVNFKYKWNTEKFVLRSLPFIKCEFSPNINSLLVSSLNGGNTFMLYDIRLKHPVYMVNIEYRIVDFSFWNNNIITALSTCTPIKKRNTNTSKSNYSIKMTKIPFNDFGIGARLICLVIKGNRDHRCKKPHLPTELWNWIVDEFF
jgi:hypothetical protein